MGLRKFAPRNCAIDGIEAPRPAQGTGRERAAQHEGGDVRILRRPARGDEPRERLGHDDRPAFRRHLRRREAGVAVQRLELAVRIADRARAVMLGDRFDEGRAQLRHAVEPRQENHLRGRLAVRHSR
jgi:hypothetical protein